MRLGVSFIAEKGVNVEDAETFTKPSKIRNAGTPDLGEQIYEYICKADAKHMRK
jgi:hypothetical protein